MVTSIRPCHQNDQNASTLLTQLRVKAYLCSPHMIIDTLVFIKPSLATYFHASL